MSRLNYLILLSLPLLIPAALFFFKAEWTVPAIEVFLTLLFLLNLWQARRGMRPFLSVPGLLPLFLLGGFMLFQLVPLPPLLLKLSPKTWELYNETIWVPRPGVWMPLSITPKETATGLVRLSAYAVLYLLTVQIISERDRVKNGVRLLTLAAGFFSLVGILGMLIPGLKFSESSPASDAIYGFFGGSSSFPGLMAIILPLAFAQFLAVRPLMKYGSLRERFFQVLERPGQNPHVFHFFPVIFISSFIILQGSKDLIPGILASISLMCLLLFMRRSYRFKALTLWVLTIFLFSAGFLAMSNGPHVPAEAAPKYTWQTSLGILSDFPITGTGFGTFDDIFPRYGSGGEKGKPANPIEVGFVTEGGVIGLCLGGWFLLAFLKGTFPAWLARRNRTAISFYPALLAVLATVPVQYAIVPNLRMPGIDFLFFFLAGLAVSASRLHSGQGKNPSRSDSAPPNSLRKAIVPGIFALAAGLVLNAGILAGKIEASSGGEMGRDDIKAPEGSVEFFERFRKAALFDPLEQSYPFSLGQASQALGQDSKTIEYFGKALRLQPLNGKQLQEMGLLFDHLGEDEKAEKLLWAGVKNDGLSPERYKTYAGWLLSKGKVHEGLDQIKNALFLAPEQTPDFLKMMALYKVPDKTMRQGLPQRSLPFLIYGDYLLDHGLEKEAEASFNTGILYAEKDPHPESILFWRVYRYYLERSRYEDALDAIKSGIRVLPGDAGFRMAAAGIYQRLGITFKAVEEYRQVLLLDPGNREAREHLKELSSD
jgi:tetratricopeptide (TPR) repeat protein